MKEAGSPKLLFEDLDLTPIHPTLWKGLHKHGPGKPLEYDPEWDLKALMLRQLEQIPYVKDLVKRLRRNPYLKQVCGYRDMAPCEASARALYDQQPIEASCMVEAALTALNSRINEKFKKTAQTAFEWYHGRNTQDVTLYNQETCPCFDGITSEGLNQNQGAEATLSYYLVYLK